MSSARISAGRLNRRELLVVAGAAASASLAPAIGWAAPPHLATDEIIDMTMNSPSYATPIGYGRAEDPHDGLDPLAFAF